MLYPTLGPVCIVMYTVPTLHVEDVSQPKTDSKRTHYKPWTHMQVMWHSHPPKVPNGHVHTCTVPSSCVFTTRSPLQIQSCVQTDAHKAKPPDSAELNQERGPKCPMHWCDARFRGFCQKRGLCLNYVGGRSPRGQSHLTCLPALSATERLLQTPPAERVQGIFRNVFGSTFLALCKPRKPLNMYGAIVKKNTLLPQTHCLHTTI